jgi:hypothetical protein
MRDEKISEESKWDNGIRDSGIWVARREKMLVFPLLSTM